MTIKSKILFILLSLPFALSAQWIQLDPPESFDIMNVINSDTIVFSSGSADGKIYSTFDGGTTWSEFLNYQDDLRILDFDFISDQTGYACGGKYENPITTAVIFKTENAGLTWDTVKTVAINISSFSNIEFLNEDTGFVSENRYLYRTYDGGQNLTQIGNNEFLNANITDLHLSPDGVLFLVGQKAPASEVYIASMYRSADLGETWSRVYLDTLLDTDYYYNRYINDIDFPTAETGYAVAGNRTFLKTTDAGFTWNLVETETFPILLYTVDFLTADLGYTNSALGVFKTTDGGLNWEHHYINSVFSHIYDIQFSTPETGYVNTSEGLFKTTSGGVTSVNTKPTPNIDITVFPNPTKNSVNLKYSQEIEIYEIQMIDITGRIINSLSAETSTIDVGNLNSGNYLLRMTTNKGLVVRKLLVE